MQKRCIAAMIAAVMTIASAAPLTVSAESVEASATEGLVQEDQEFTFEYWTEGAPSLETLKEYVADVTDEASPNYIPAADRIAVIDMDGTVYGELAPIYLEWWMFSWRVLDDPTFEADAEMIEVAQAVRKAAADRSIPEGLEIAEAEQQTRAFADMTLTEYTDYVTEFLLKDVWGFEGMTYAEAFYQPMIELVDYLRANDFICYLVSGSDRFACRTLIEGILDIPDENVIGMDVKLEASGQNGADGLNYVLEPEDEIVRTDILLIKDVKMNKVVQIAKEIGRQPVLSFGNSSGDTSMAMYVTNKNKYKSAAFMLVADDTERDWADPEKAVSMREKWEGYGWNIISMRDDFKTIYPEGAVRLEEMPAIEGLPEETDAAQTDEAAQVDAAQEDTAQAEDAQTDAAQTDDAAQAEPQPEPAPEGYEETPEQTAQAEEVAPADETVQTDEAAQADETAQTDDAAQAEPQPEPAPEGYEEAAAGEQQAASDGDLYVVQEGDNLWQIAIKTTGTGSMYEQIAQANGLEDPYDLVIGQELVIPAVTPAG